MKLTIYKGLHRSKIDAPKDVLEKIRQSLRIPIYQYSAFYKESTKVGEQDFVHEDGTFRSGLLELITGRLYSWYMDYDVVEPSPQSIPRLVNYPIDAIPNYDIQGSRAYQLRAIDELKKHQRGIWFCATNSGKTYMAAAAIRHFGLRTIYLVPPQRSGLVDQAHQDFTKLGFQSRELSTVKASALTDTHVVIASTATLHARIEDDKTRRWLKRFQMVVYDECHELPPSSIQVLDHVDAPYRLFMSGTPFTGDQSHDLMVSSMSGKILARITNDELIQLGISAEPHIVYVPFKHPTIHARPRFDKLYADQIVNNEDRNNLICAITRMLVKSGELPVIMVSRKAHARALCSMLGDCHIQSAVFTGETDNRSSVIRRLREGELQVLVANQVFDVGLSVPEVTALVNAGAGKVEHTNLQRAGRGLRKKEHRNVFFWIDIQDHCLYITKHSEARRETFRKQRSFVKHEAPNGLFDVVKVISEVSALKA